MIKQTLIMYFIVFAINTYHYICNTNTELKACIMTMKLKLYGIDLLRDAVDNHIAGTNYRFGSPEYLLGKWKIFFFVLCLVSSIPTNSVELGNKSIKANFTERYTFVKCVLQNVCIGNGIQIVLNVW